MILAVINATFAVAKRKSQKKRSRVRIPYKAEFFTTLFLFSFFIFSIALPAVRVSLLF